MLIRISLMATILVAGCMTESPPSDSIEQADSNLGCEFFIKLSDGSGTCLQGGYTGSTVAGPDKPVIVYAGAPSASTPPSGIKIAYAFYGQNCTHNARNLKWTLNPVCQGQQSCWYTIDSSVVGDPAYGCAKDAHIAWYCSDPGPTYYAALPPEADGSTVFLSCPNG